MPLHHQCQTKVRFACFVRPGTGASQLGFSTVTLGSRQRYQPRLAADNAPLVKVRDLNAEDYLLLAGH